MNRIIVGLIVLLATIGGGYVYTTQIAQVEPPVELADAMDTEAQNGGPMMVEDTQIETNAEATVSAGADTSHDVESDTGAGMQVQVQTQVETELPLKLDTDPVAEAVTAQEPEQKTESGKFACENDMSVNSRAYVLLLGFNNNNNPTGAQTWIDTATAGDVKNRGNLVFAYDKSRSLADLGADFINRFNTFIGEKKPEEVVVIGWSAGGTILASQAHNLRVSGDLEIHTVASPLKGYSLKGFLESLLDGQTGFAREIGLGFGPFVGAPANAKVYHHKTVTDSDLSGRCGNFAAFCNPLTIQNNNLSSAKEFYYPEYDHELIMTAVAQMVINCRK